jgi:hypothetical protein
MSYGADLRYNLRETARYVQLIIDGTPPGELPIIQALRNRLIRLPASTASVDGSGTSTA